MAIASVCNLVTQHVPVQMLTSNVPAHISGMDLHSFTKHRMSKMSLVLLFKQQLQILLKQQRPRMMNQVSCRSVTFRVENECMAMCNSLSASMTAQGSSESLSIFLSLYEIHRILTVIAMLPWVNIWKPG